MADPKVSDLFKQCQAEMTKAHEKHKNDEVRMGFVDLPPGINNGIAEVKELNWGVYQTGDNKGKLYLMGQASILTPEFVQTPDGPMKVRGLQTKLGPLPLCATGGNWPKTFDENYAIILNEIHKLGVDVSAIKPSQMEAVTQALAKRKVCTRFSTRLGKPAQPKPGQTEPGPTPVKQYWNGACERPVLEDSETSDDTETPDEQTGAQAENGEAASEEVVETAQAKRSRKTASAAPKATTMKTAPKTNGKPTQVKGATTTVVSTSSPDTAFDEFDGDLDSLALKADKGDKKAMQTLKKAALAAGVDADAVDNADAWSDVVAMIPPPLPAEDAEQGEDENEEEETIEPSDGGQTWQMGDVCLYPPMDKTTGKRGPAVECKIDGIDTGIGAVTLSCLTDKRRFKSVKMELLQPA